MEKLSAFWRAKKIDSDREGLVGPAHHPLALLYCAFGIKPIKRGTLSL